ncbi:hypothetical protein AWH62_02960 [Maricaulis sp. W15]|uniref:DUF2891 domain-containing protein n=1 Tax=Maricaulis sp. W15 TaxID=1772333 RepID=UPI00094913F5|nr:DUF2891 domain-containing protein [Maricaulis sp. W15]OLF77649.1 hypothetical protein AWH62_02960 [Maricaulis sp. W15]
MLSRTFFAIIANFAFLCSNIAEAQSEAVSQDQERHFLQLALDCVDREYPNKISHVLQSDTDALTPRALHPAFYGCFDWHSAVHGHWLIVRLLRGGLDAEAEVAATTALDAHLNTAAIAGEVAYFQAEGRASFERPYGLAWLLQLGAELREWDDPRARRWSQALAPLEAVIADRYRSWLPNLAYPVRIGTHNQSAFGFALALDWARTAGDAELEGMLVDASLRFHREDRACPIRYEPSGEDFLSPCLMEADLMRRVLDQADFAAWLTGFLPDIPHDGSADWLEPGVVLDASDGKLVHLDGVNLSRAWNLEAIADSLPADDPRRDSLMAASARHAASGIASVTGDDYAGGHWLASFATYLVTGRALDIPR